MLCFKRIIPFSILALVVGSFFVISQAKAVNYLASDLLGQLDAEDEPIYTTSTSGVSLRRMNFPTLMVLDTTRHRLFLSDSNNSRVLVFNLDSSNNLIDRLPDYVLGQANFNTSSTEGILPNTFNFPAGLAYDPIQDRLFVGDANRNRVLIFDVRSIVNHEDAISVLGQPDFTSSAASTSQSGLNFPIPGGFDATRNLLYVSDLNNNRIMVFDVATTTNGELAVNVLGQPSFNAGTSSLTDTGLDEPQVSLIDTANQRLFVSDKENNRVLIFSVASTTNGQAAISVLGQPDFITENPTSTQTGMNGPVGLAYDSSTDILYVADADNSRVLLFDVATTTNGEAAVNVLGQPNFSSSTAAASQSNFAGVIGLVFDEEARRLYVADGGHRIMIFDFVSITNSSFPNGTVGSSYGPTLSIVNNQGTTTLSISSGSVPTGLSSILSGTPTVPGTYYFTLRATDAFSTGNILSNKNYTITITSGASIQVAPSLPSGGGGGVSAIQAIIAIKKSVEEIASSTIVMDQALETRTPGERTIHVQATQLKLVSLLVRLLDLMRQLLVIRSGVV